jgi:carbamoyltransferase
MILGISNAVHNSSAALVDNGTIINAVDEERISRHKRDGRIPVGAVNAVLRESQPSTITSIAVSGVAGASIGRRIDRKITNSGIPSPVSFAKCYDGLWQRGISKELVKNTADELAAETPLESDSSRLVNKMEYVDHHYAHAAGAYFTSGFDEATVLTVDSGGDGLSSSVYHGYDGSLSLVFANSSVDSIGALWSKVPTVFGFKGARHAGKFMGLAAYAQKPPVELREKVEELIQIDGMNITNPWKKNTGNEYETQVRDLRDRFGQYTAPQVARALQTRTKEIIAELARNAVNETGCSNVAISGGVMANVKANQRIYQLPTVEKVWVQQAMSDSGLSIGNAYVLGARDFGWQPERLESVALGPSYGEQALTNAIRQGDTDAEFEVGSPTDVDSIATTVADHLVDNDVVCLFRGRMEYGPRALGQRSILYPPTDPDAIDWLNKRLDRTEFMPFAPVTLREAAKECYEGYDAQRCPAADHMTTSFDCTDTMKERSPGVVHVDGTARPQIIDESDDELYYSILQAYYERSGIPSLINTSFNMHGEPIVCTPKQAVESWRKSTNELLVLEDRILKQGVNQ